MSVLLPVRDEERRVALVPGLAARPDPGRRPRGPGARRRVHATGRRTSSAQVASGDPRVRLLTGGDDVPDGWLGKTWACHRLLAGGAAGRRWCSSTPTSGSRRTRSPPPSTCCAAAASTSSRPTRASSPPRLGERLVQPLLAVVVPQHAAAAAPPSARRRPSLSAANGQFLAVDAAAYRRAGGHAAVRGEVLDDVALLRALKRAGGRGVVVDGTHARHLPDVRGLAGAARGLHEVAVVGVRVAAGRRRRRRRARGLLRRPAARRAARVADRAGRVRSRRSSAGTRSPSAPAAARAGRARPPGVRRRARLADRAARGGRAGAAS